MTRKNVWLVALLAVTGAGAVWLLNPFAGEEGAAATPGGSWADEPDFGPASALSAARPDEANLARTAVPADPAPETDDEEDGPRPALTVSGRVISDGGVPVADARVAVNYRLSFEGMRGRELGGGERGRAFRRRPAAESVRTDREGRFTLQGRAFAASTLDVVVAHKDYAPATVQREWQRRDGIVELGDITVATGAIVSGFVVDKNGQGIEGAEVRVLGNDGPFGMGPGGRGGRGGRGNEDEGDAGSLVAAVKTDRVGFFRMEHVPEGRFRLQARAARYLPALTEALQAKSATMVDAGQLQLILGVQLRGVVVDPSGAPIADARVEAGAARGEGHPGDNEQGRQAGRQRQANGAEQQPDWQALAAAWRAGGNDRRTRTDKRGEFVLDSLPPTALRLRVEHPRFISEERQPIEANKEPRVTVRLEPALAITGRVVDAATGEPIEEFAIAAREAEDWGTRDFGFGNRGGGNESGRGRRGGDGEGRRRGGGNTEAGDASSDELAAMRAAEEARRAQRTAYLHDRLGPTGQVPRNPGRASKHTGGNFTLPGLQPGRYVVEVMADDYVAVVSGPIELVKGQAAGDMTVSLRRGSRIAGRVEDKVTGLPLAGVSVELQLPDLEAAPQSTDGPWTAFRREAGRVRVARARTDSTGRFVLRPQRSGDYWLALEHDGYNTFVDRAVFVPAAQPLETPAYALVPSSCVFGQVRNPQPGKQYTLSFWSTSGQRVTARTDKDFRYRVESIEPGSYYALLSDGAGGGEPGGRGGRGGPLGSMGTRLAEFARGNTQPDVVIGEGAQVQFDFDARAQAPATVKGKVLLNGNAASGYDVALAAREENSTGNNGNGFPSRMLGRLLSARTDEQGEFTIPNVPAGQYTLELRRGGGGPGGRGGRGGGGGGATVHREPIFVTQGATVERTLMFAIGSLAFEVVTDPEAKPIERGNVQLVLRTEAATVAPDQWRTLPSFTNAQVRTGAASVRELKLGEWTYRVQAQGQQTLEGVVFVDATPTPAPVKVKLKPATAAPAPNGTSAGTGNR